MFRTSLFVIAVAASAIVVQPASARDTTAETVKVSIRGLDLSKPSDVQTLHTRLQAAAHRVCDIPGDSLAVREDNQDCRDRAVRTAARAVGQPTLTFVSDDDSHLQPTQIAVSAPKQR